MRTLEVNEVLEVSGGMRAQIGGWAFGEMLNAAVEIISGAIKNASAESWYEYDQRQINCSKMPKIRTCRHGR